MSVQAMSWVFGHSPTEGTERLILLSLANHGGELVERDGVVAWEAWPGVATIAREARLKRERTAQDALTRMVQRGSIARTINGAPDERIRRDRRPTLYRVLLSDGVPCGDTRCGWCGVSLGAERGDAPASDGVSAERATGCREATPEPSVEPSVEPPGETLFGGSAAPTTGKAKAKKPAKVLEGNALIADQLARARWEASDIKPVCGFMALRARIGEALDAGHSEAAVAAAVPRMTVFSRNAFDLELGRQPRGKPVDADRAAASGGQAL